MPHERPAATSGSKGVAGDQDVDAALGRAAERIVLARLGVFFVAALALFLACEAGCLWLVMRQSRVVVYAPDADAQRPFETAGEGETP